MSAAASAELTPLGNEPRFEGGAQRVGDGVWAWIQPNGELGESNAGLVVGAGESLLVDTLWDERLTARMLAGLTEARREAPIRRLVNTHGDGDHWYGNGLVGDAEIIATEAAAEQMEAEPPSMPARMAPLPKAARALAALPMVPARDRLRGFAEFGRMLAAYDFAHARPRLPQTRFRERATVDVGGRRVELIEVGPAHTTGDALVWVPDVGVLFSGDIVFNGVTPIIWAGPAANWIAALERIAAFEPGAIVPGHGPVAETAVLEELIAYWDHLARAVPSGDGDASALAAELITSPEYRSAPWGSWRAPERTLVNIAMIARERRGEQGPVGLAARISLLAAMGALRSRLRADPPD